VHGEVDSASTTALYIKPPLFHVEQGREAVLVRTMFHVELRYPAQSFGVADPARCQKVGFPTRGLVGWGFADHNPASRAGKSRRHPQGGRRRTEPSCHHGIGLPLPLGVVGQRFGVSHHCRHSLTPAQRGDGPLEGVDSLGAAIHQGDPHGGAVKGDYQAWHARPCAKVKHRPDRIGECRYKSPGMGDHLGDGSRSKSALDLRPPQELREELSIALISIVPRRHRLSLNGK